MSLKTGFAQISSCCPKFGGGGGRGGCSAPRPPPARTPTGKGVNVVPEHGMKKMLIPIHYPTSLRNRYQEIHSIRRFIWAPWKNASANL